MIAIDGKTLHHSFNLETQSALHSMTVWSQSRSLIFSQKKSSDKQNEQPAVMEVCRKRSDNGKETQEKVFYISRLDVDIQSLAKCVRGHWEVENKAHWVLDVVYKED